MKWKIVLRLSFSSCKQALALWLIVLGVLGNLFVAKAQNLTLHISYQNTFEKTPNFAIPEQLKAQELVTFPQNFIQQLHHEGFWKAFIDTLYVEKTTFHVHVNLGKRSYWKDFYIDVPAEILQATLPKFEEAKLFNTPVRHQTLQAIQEKLLTWSEQNGYPMARVRLDSIALEERTDKVYFSAKLLYQKGILIRFDSLYIDGNGYVQKDFLMSYLHIAVHKIYDERIISNAERLLKTMPYVKLTDKPKVEFKYGRAYVRLPLKKVKSNQFDGVIGFLPQEQTPSSGSSRLLLTGQVRLHLLNPFGRGKTIRFEWQRIRPQSQTLLATYRHPNFLKTKLELGGRFNFLKEDSTFSQHEFRFDIAYPSPKLGKIGFFTSSFSTFRLNLIQNADTSAVPTADSRFWHYGIFHDYTTLDDPFFPRKGLHMQTEISAGNKTLTDSLSRSSVLDAPSQNDFSNPQIRLIAEANQYIRISELSTLRIKAQAQWIESKYLFVNELLRVGGLQTMRGFDPNSFFVSKYALLGTEWRFYFEERSFLMAFAEQGFTKRFTLSNEPFLDYPLSAGAGLSFATQTGIFYFVFAMGKSDRQAFSVSNSKIHFGLSSRF